MTTFRRQHPRHCITISCIRAAVEPTCPQCPLCASIATVSRPSSGIGELPQDADSFIGRSGERLTRRGGERQQLAIRRALKAEGLAILNVDKNFAALLLLADQHVVIEKGHVVWSGTTAELAASRSAVMRFLDV